MLARAATSATSPRARSRTRTARTPEDWLARRVYYGRTAAPLAKRHPGNARPLHVSPWTTAAWAALATKRPKTALAITAAGVALLARELPPKTAAETRRPRHAALRPVFADALRRFYWPLAFARPKLFAAAAITHPLKLADDLAYGAGVWIGCLQHRTLDPLLPVPRLAAGTPYCRAVGAIARLATGRRSKWVVIAAWIVAALVAFPFQSKLQTLASDESGAFESRDAESTQVADLIEQRFPGGADTTTTVLYTRDGPFTPQDAERVAQDGAKLCQRDVGPRHHRRSSSAAASCPKLAPPPSAGIGSESGDLTTQFTTVWTRDDATEAVVRDVAATRAIVPDPDAEGLRAYVTGEAGLRRRPGGGARGHRRDAARGHARADPDPAAGDLPLAGARARAAGRRRHRLPRRRRASSTRWRTPARSAPPARPRRS